MNEKLTRADWRFILICAVLFAGALAVVLSLWSRAFPEASLSFAYDRESSRRVAESLLAQQGLDPKPMKHAVLFDSDGQARIFLERSLGLEDANRFTGKLVHVWYWHHRWFVPLQEEELGVDVAPTGAIVRFSRELPEARAIADVDGGAARALAESFLPRVGVDPKALTFIGVSERKLPKRTQRIFTWESPTIRPANAPYRHTVTIDGNVVSDYEQRLKVPDPWLRSYRQLRARNEAAGAADTIIMIITLVAAIVIFIACMRRGEVHIRFVLGIAAVAFVLMAGVALNSMPEIKMGYPTTASYPAHLAQYLGLSLLSSGGTAMMLVVICGAGEVLYRRRLPKQLAMPLIWNRRALTSKRVFRSLILGYTLVPLFIAYQVLFYLTAKRFGAWSPADTPYDDILNSAIPWIAVLLAGFAPAFSEEFLSRAFSIPFFQRYVRSRFVAIVIAAFAWGFGHSLYAHQPFWIRGVEVGLVGIVMGYVMDRYGLLALLVWHYTIDAVYTALLLFRSDNLYYVFSAALASLVFALPLLASIVQLIRNRGFVPDEALTNAALPEPKPLDATPHEAEAPHEPFPRVFVTPKRLALCALAIAAAIALAAVRTPSPAKGLDYDTTKAEAKQLATAHMQQAWRGAMPATVIAAPAAGFRAWSSNSTREDGGSPGGFDSIAATYLLRKSNVQKVNETFRDSIEARTWSVRFFTPEKKEEAFVELDPRRAQVVGYHKYQEETAPGAKLERAKAEAIATNALAGYRLAPASFIVREALVFEQPQRRDWLFHFEERKPIAADVFRRVTVRVAGDEVTQVNKHVHIPAEEYRRQSSQSILNVILGMVQLIALLVAMAILIVGLVMIARSGTAPWRRAAKWTAILAIIPIATQLANREISLFSYATSVEWATYQITMVIDFVRIAGFQIALIFIALAAIFGAIPRAADFLRREGRMAFGRDAVTGAITAIALAVAMMLAVDLIDSAFPSLAVIHGVNVPDEVAQPFPSLLAIGSAVVAAVLFSGVAAMYALVLQNAKRAWIAPVVVLLLAFGLGLQSSVTTEEMPLMLFHAVMGAALLWIVKSVLGDNPLAWPLAAFLVFTLGSLRRLAGHDRFDLQLHAAVVALAIAFAIGWLTVHARRNADA
jgi:membrane protease YdiL (CAAX protease family)